MLACPTARGVWGGRGGHARAVPVPVSGSTNIRLWEPTAMGGGRPVRSLTDGSSSAGGATPREPPHQYASNYTRRCTHTLRTLHVPPCSSPSHEQKRSARRVSRMARRWEQRDAPPPAVCGPWPVFDGSGDDKVRLARALGVAVRPRVVGDLPSHDAFSVNVAGGTADKGRGRGAAASLPRTLCQRRGRPMGGRGWGGRQHCACWQDCQCKKQQA